MYLTPDGMWKKQAGGKGGKGQKGAASASAEGETESLDDIAGIPETKARFDRVLEVRTVQQAAPHVQM